MISRYRSAILKHGFWRAHREMIRYRYLSVRPAWLAELELGGVAKARLAGSRELESQIGSRVKYGPMAGYKLPGSSTWSSLDRGGMLLGIYEQPISDLLVKFSKTHSVLVDLGAADGYFGVGMVATGNFVESFCFESDEASRQTLRQSAIENMCIDKVHVHGHAGADFLTEISKIELRDCVFLIDIEGGEFELLSADTLSQTSSSYLIVELHPWNAPEGAVQELIARASQFFSFSIIDSGPRDPSLFRELDGFEDDIRWALCSEGRNAKQEWLVLSPKSKETSI